MDFRLREFRRRGLLQLIHYAWRSLDEAYVIGQKPVDAETIQEGLAPGWTQELHQELLKLGVVAQFPAWPILPGLATITPASYPRIVAINVDRSNTVVCGPSLRLNASAACNQTTPLVRKLL